MSVEDPNIVERVFIRNAASRTKGTIDWLNGKKTFLGLLVIMGPDIAQHLGQLCIAYGLDPHTVATIVGSIVSGFGIAHKVIKGLRAAGVLDEEKEVEIESTRKD